MEKNEIKGIRHNFFVGFFVAGIALAVILQMLWIPSVQQRILEFGELLIGRSLRRHEKWIEIMKQVAVFGSLLTLCFPFYFYEFKIHDFSCKQEINLKIYGGGYTTGLPAF